MNNKISAREEESMAEPTPMVFTPEEKSALISNGFEDLEPENANGEYSYLRKKLEVPALSKQSLLRGLQAISPAIEESDVPEINVYMTIERPAFGGGSNDDIEIQGVIRDENNGEDWNGMFFASSIDAWFSEIIPNAPMQVVLEHCAKMESAIIEKAGKEFGKIKKILASISGADFDEGQALEDEEEEPLSKLSPEERRRYEEVQQNLAEEERQLRELTGN